MPAESRKNAAGRRSRSGLAVIHGEGAIAVGKVDQHEAAAAQVPSPRESDRKRQRRGDGSVDRVAAAFKDIETDLRGRAVLGDDHSVLRDNGQAASALSDNRRHDVGSHRA